MTTNPLAPTPQVGAGLEEHTHVWKQHEPTSTG